MFQSDCSRACRGLSVFADSGAVLIWPSLSARARILGQRFLRVAYRLAIASIDLRSDRFEIFLEASESGRLLLQGRHSTFLEISEHSNASRLDRFCACANLFELNLERVELDSRALIARFKVPLGRVENDVLLEDIRNLVLQLG